MRLSGIVIAKNEEKMISDCLVSLEFCDEVILVDSSSSDATIQVAKEHGTIIMKTQGTDYSQFRNDGLKAAKGDWVLFLDADERITPGLRQEILKVVGKDFESVYQIPRQNIYLGRVMRYGGWGNDYVIRLFPKKLLKHYSGALHEQPVYEGKLESLTNSMTHFSHRNLESMLQKTLDFTAYEAQLRIKTHPRMVPWRFVRVMATEFYHRFIKLSAWRDGVEGVIDGSFQVFNTFIIYARVWEGQLKL